MPLSKYVIQKRALNPVRILQRAKEHLTETCSDASLEESILILETAEFMNSTVFQELIHIMPIAREQRQTVETRQMKATIWWFYAKDTMPTTTEASRT